VINVEQGHPRAELALVLRALDVLGIAVDANSGGPTSRGSISAVDINAIITKAKKGKT